jgi:hypothetical protein
VERAVEFFGASKLLSAIEVKDLELWVAWLRKNYSGKRGNKTLSDGAIRHSLNALGPHKAPGR